MESDVRPNEQKQPAPAGEEHVKEQKKRRVRDGVKAAVLVILCLLILPLLISNLTLIIKGSLYPDRLPDLFGIAPLAAGSDDMAGDAEGCFDEGALIFIDLLDEEEVQALQVGDVVVIRSQGSGEALQVIHLRIVAIDGADGKVLSFRVLGDNSAANGVTEPLVVSASNVIGKVTGSIAGLGSFALFLQTPVGVLVFVGIPVVAYLIYDIVRITLHNRRVRQAQSEQLKEKDEEIARLRAAAAPAEDASAAASAPAQEEKQEETR